MKTLAIATGKTLALDPELALRLGARLDTLFAHLASRFAPSAENIAIEALGFILDRSAAARAAFTDTIGGTGSVMPADLRFATQAAADDLARPDIEAYGSDGHRHCVIECKFWAGLTANQPLTYATRLSSDRPGALVFVVPSARLTSLWTELGKRMKAGAVQLGARREAHAEVWTAPFGAGHAFVLASWRAVLAAILRGMEDAGEVNHIGDLRQLVGLCEKMDTEAFHPFRPEELTAIDHPRRNLQLGQIAYDVGEALIADGHCDTRRLTPSSGLGYYGRYLRAHETVFFLGFDSAAWAAHKLTPLWVRFDQVAPPEVLAVLRRTNVVADDVPVVVEKDRRILLPLFVEPGVERPQIVQQVAAQTATILDAVHRLVPVPALQPAQEPLS